MESQSNLRLCVFCLRGRALTIKDAYASDEQLALHLESVHHIVVPRDGETMEKAIARFLRDHPVARDCAACRAEGAPWTKRPLAPEIAAALAEVGGDERPPA